MAKASWAHQSFKKTDRAKYADGGRVDLSSSDYADNSAGTWGAMGQRAMEQRQDDAARGSINRTTDETVGRYDDSEEAGDRITDSFRDRSEPSGQDDDTARKIEAASPAKPYDETPVKVAVAAKRTATKPSNEGQADRALTRANRAGSDSDQNDRALRRAEARVPTPVVDYGDEADRMARRYPVKKRPTWKKFITGKD